MQIRQSKISRIQDINQGKYNLYLPFNNKTTISETGYSSLIIYIYMIMLDKVRTEPLKLEDI